jgi:hypothetical protein
VVHVSGYHAHGGLVDDVLTVVVAGFAGACGPAHFGVWICGEGGGGAGGFSSGS